MSPVDVLICSVDWRVPACLDLLSRLRAQTVRPRRVVLRADSWSAEATAQAQHLGAVVQEVEPGCGQQPRWLAVECWDDPEAIVMVIDDDVQPPSEALEGCLKVMGEDKRLLVSPAGISTTSFAEIHIAWGSVLAAYPEAFHGLGTSDLAQLLRPGMSDELVVAAWLRRVGCTIRRHPIRGPWPVHVLSDDDRAFSLQPDNLTRKMDLLNWLESKDKLPDSNRVWASMRSTVRHQQLVAARTQRS